LYAVVNVNMGYMIVCDEQMMNSVFMQLFVFGNGGDYYEKVSSSPMLKIFRVKRGTH